MRATCEQLREEITRQQFDSHPRRDRQITRETVNALRKDVLAKCYGGDITRKRKLLEKQKEGKKRFRWLHAELPQSAPLRSKTKEN